MGCIACRYRGPNSIILIDYINEESSGHALEEAALEAGERRLRRFPDEQCSTVGVTP